MTAWPLTDAFFASFDSSVLDTDDAEALPPACYTNESFFAFEKAALFDHEWLCVGRESWARKPGEYFTATHVGEPIVVVRDNAGELQALSAVCQHRGMLVAEGCGSAKFLICPYHHWTYSLNGELVGAPAMERARGFDKSKVRLPALKLEVWQGFVFVNFDPAAPALAPRLTAVSPILANYDLANIDGPRPDAPTRYSWNWKVMFENNNDGYHANKLHQGPLHDFVPSHLARFPKLPPDTAGYYRTNGSLHRDASFNATQKALLPIFPGLTEEDRDRMVFANVPPTLSLVLTSDMVIYLIMYAETANQHSMGYGVLVAPGAMEQPLFNERMEINGRAVGHIVSQDLHVDEMVQIGLRSRYAARGRYSWQEGAQREFNDWLVKRYRRTWERIRATQAMQSAAE